ncbi:VOC family protein [Thalassotalea mangrovi]|uniref:VOC family protein n=1 Tax=Thalassotalea mangrovi TaxID=2572245 RepID=A0A4U1B3F5_9GAMM|nr:VOC family protein [Thalassotalea mangrovi]TKB43850.1 VOC family protein [Thalassotalea mangrovi]
MLTPQHIDHIVLNAQKSPEEMLNFYCQVLGCVVERQEPEFHLTQLRAGFSIIDLLTGPNDQTQLNGKSANQRGCNNVDHFCLTVNETIDDDLLTWFADHGIECSDIHDNYGAQGFGESVYIKDPLGNTIEIKTMKPAPL